MEISACQKRPFGQNGGQLCIELTFLAFGGMAGLESDLPGQRYDTLLEEWW